MTTNEWLLIVVIVAAFLIFHHHEQKPVQLHATGPLNHGSFESVTDSNGSYMSRLGAFFGKVAQ